MKAQNVKKNLIFNHICMQIQQAHVQKTSVSSSTSRRHDPQENWQNLQRPANVFGTAENILIEWYDADGRDWVNNITRETGDADMPCENLNSEKSPFQVQKGIILQGGNLHRRSTNRPQEVCALTEMPPNNKKKHYNPFYI